MAITSGGFEICVTCYPQTKFIYVAFLYFSLQILELFSAISCTFSLAVIISNSHQHAKCGATALFIPKLSKQHNWKTKHYRNTFKERGTKVWMMAWEGFLYVKVIESVTFISNG